MITAKVMEPNSPCSTRRVFHTAPILLESGSIILPGNFGRIIKQNEEKHKLWRREKVLEEIREREFPQKPSRLSSTFCSSTFEIARLFRDLQRPSELIYEVEYVDETCPIHTGDYNCVEPLVGRSESMEEVARLYWTNKLKTNLKGVADIPCEELVCASPIKVIELRD
jgi:hypothetical protein